jgi:bacteriocin-like protein
LGGEWNYANLFFIIMKNFEVLSTEKLKNVKGGRTVIKIDRDGDGKWDEKHVWTNRGHKSKYR